MNFQDQGRREHDYEGYELHPHENHSLAAIKQQLFMGYQSEVQLRSHIDFLEELCARLDQVLAKEQGLGYRNVTLEHDFQKAQLLLLKLSQLLNHFD